MWQERCNAKRSVFRMRRESDGEQADEVGTRQNCSGKDAERAGDFEMTGNGGGGRDGLS